MIYVIGEARRGIVKIGVAENPANRLRVIQAGNPRPLQVLATFPGGRAEESAMHRAWRHRCVGGEWFDFDDSDPVVAVASAFGAPALRERATCVRAYAEVSPRETSRTNELSELRRSDAVAADIVATVLADIDAGRLPPGSRTPSQGEIHRRWPDAKAGVPEKVRRLLRATGKVDTSVGTRVVFPRTGGADAILGALSQWSSEDLIALRDGVDKLLSAAVTQTDVA